MNPIPLIGFATAYAQNAVLATIQNRLVAAHVRATPRLSTTNIVGDIYRESLELGIRRLECRRHTLQTRIVTLGEEILHGPTD